MLLQTVILIHPMKTHIKLTLPATNSSHLKMDGWNTIVSFWGNFGLFSGAKILDSRRVDTQKHNKWTNKPFLP